MATARCTKCGSENPKEALFCTACGQALHHEQNDPLIGQTIGGRYYLVERIGQGAAGTIYRAEHTTLRRRMALKLLHQQLAQNEDAVERFRREAITVCEIDNDHIPQVFDFGRAEDGRLFFAMEFLDGAPLSTVLEQEGRLTPERTADILSQVGDGLMEAHTLGYIHRDLRPRSIFLTRRRGKADFVKILDFGLAKLVQPELTDAQRTAMGMTYGDPRYMAPEQARGEVVDRRADIYSLGVLGYEMVCGEPPFKGTGTFDILSKLLEAPVPRLRDKRPDCPPWLESVIRTALAKKPAERFQTVAQFLDAMERKSVLANQPPMPMQVTPGARADAMKKLTPMSAPDGGSTKGQEVRAFVSSPGMKPITVPVDVSSRPAQTGTQVMPTVAPGTQAAALAASIETTEAPQHERPQSIKKTLAYPAIKVGQRSEPVTAAPPVSNTPVEPQRPAISRMEGPAATSAPRVAPVAKPATTAEAAKAPAKSIQSGFVNIVATTIERGDPTPRTARAMLEQESLAWEEAALPALLTNEVDLTDAAVSSERTRLPPSADTPVEEMKFDSATANRTASPVGREPASVKAAIQREPSAPTSVKAIPSREPSVPTAVKPVAAKESSGPAATKVAATREPSAKEVSTQTGQRDSSRVAAMSTPAPVAGREPSGPAQKLNEAPKAAAVVVSPSPTVDIPRTKLSTSSTEVRPLSAPVLGRSTKPGMGPASTEPSLPSTPVLESAPVSAVATTLHNEETGPSQRHDETQKVVKTDTTSATETVKQPRLSISELTQSETIKVEKVAPTAAPVESDESADESDTVVTTRSDVAKADSDEARPSESERTPESPPPEMGSENDAGWFAQSDSPTTAVGLIDDDDAPSLRQKTPRWVIPAALSAVAVLGLLFFTQSGSQKGTDTSATAASSAEVTVPASKVEVAPIPPTATTDQPAKPSEAPAAAAVVPAAKPEASSMVEPKPEAIAKPVPTAEPLPVKAEPKPEPVAAKEPAKPEPKPPIAKAEPKPEPKPAAKPEPKPPIAKAEPKPEPKPAAKPEPKPPIAKAEPKPEPKPAAKPEPKPPIAKAEPKPELKPPVDAAPAKNTSEVSSLVSLGKQKLDDGDVDAAIASFKRAVQMDGKNADAVAGLGEASFEQGNFDGAAKYLAQAAKLSPRKLSYQELLAQAQFKLGRYKEAAETCRKILKENPGSGRAKQTLEQAEKKLDDM